MRISDLSDSYGSFRLTPRPSSYHNRSKKHVVKGAKKNIERTREKRRFLRKYKSVGLFCLPCMPCVRRIDRTARWRVVRDYPSLLPSLPRSLARSLAAFFIRASHACMLTSARALSGAGRQRDELGLGVAAGSQVFPPGAELVVHNKVRWGRRKLKRWYSITGDHT